MGEQTFHSDRQSDASSLLHRPVAEPLDESRRHQRLFRVWTKGSGVMAAEYNNIRPSPRFTIAVDAMFAAGETK